MAPSGQDTYKQEYQDDDQDDSHTILLLSSFPFQLLSLLKRFRNVLGIAHELSFYQTRALFSINNPTTAVTTNPNHFLFPPACGLLF
jgi:hypothetical protein